MTYMKKFKQIIIHPDCPETAREFKLYSYKVNRAGDVLPEILDLNNHHMDGIRYSLQPLIKSTPTRVRPGGGGSRVYT